MMTKWFLSYSILATSNRNDSVTNLIPGLSFIDDVEFNEFKYYVYRPYDHPGADIRLHVRPIVGDVDMYVSSSWESRPLYSPITRTVESYSFSSASIGDDDILIRHSSFAALCGDKQCVI
jgi:hypothetical protein